MKILDNLSGWFADLQPRERVIITVGAALLVVAAIYMALLPAMQKSAELEQRHQSLSEDLEWLREQGEVVSSLSSGCAGQTVQDGKKNEVITRIVRKNQLKLLGLEQNDLSFYSLSVSGASPNRVLQLIHQLTCQGLALEVLEIEASSDKNVAYVADIEVRYVD
jgi:type II secretory pathway component PulM